ncbi:unnamed protein product [Didymodactylos carnosus]|uniref:ABC transmembrane type-1 domain-containing protein n=1 Tax=Didymodactylos carnosus TaxID=1234261 RepID=A0A815H648_9BILA|nr:unnamed protein product [Didymodactylos carnosus]CAF1349796.1 unnamed protein product [Didymodactylos carnosus]CAF4027348.1 unnamed protein product [Didymodactylos carnosus]CAF4218851.1 unnamed protein product [Didymodactylos carnosus]
MPSVRNINYATPLNVGGIHFESRVIMASLALDRNVALDPLQAEYYTQHANVRFIITEVTLIEELGTEHPKYKYADIWDVILMTIGTLASLSTGASFALMFTLYKIILNNFLNFEKARILNTSAIAFNSTSECFLIETSGNLLNTVKSIIIYYLIIGFVTVFLFWLGFSCWMIAGERQIRRIRYYLFRSILRQEIGWFDTINIGDLNQRLISDIDRISNGIRQKVPNFISLIARVIGNFTFALFNGWKLALVFMSIVPFVVLTLNLTEKVIIKYTRAENQWYASVSSIAQEAFQSIRTVTSFHGQRKEEEK